MNQESTFDKSLDSIIIKAHMLTKSILLTSRCRVSKMSKSALYFSSTLSDPTAELSDYICPHLQ